MSTMRRHRGRQLAVKMLVVCATLTAAGGASLASAPNAIAHLTHPNGVWTYRYLTRGTEYPTNHCNTGAFGVDPLNVIWYQYGEGNRMDGHVQNETHWAHYEGWAPGHTRFFVETRTHTPVITP